MKRLDRRGDTALVLVCEAPAGHDENDKGDRFAYRGWLGDLQGYCLPGDGVISVMLTVDLLLLILAVWFAVRIVRRSQVRASVDDDPPAEFAAVLADLVSAPGAVAQNERFAVVATQDRTLTFATAPRLSLLDQANHEDLYADPIDGVPFTPGEKIHTCRCGVGYRRESLEWMTENLSGRCVHCGCAVESSQVVETCH